MAQATEFSPPEEMAFDYVDVYRAKGYRCRVFYQNEQVVIESIPALPEPWALCLAFPVMDGPEKTC